MTIEERQRKKIEAQAKANWVNSQEWEIYNKDLYDCSICRNKGGSLVVHWVDEYEDYCLFWRDCSCMSIRRERGLLDDSGLYTMQERYKFNNYQTFNKLQEKIKTAAERYIKEAEAWFYIGGQSGAGKTHICTAIATEHLKKGNSVLYMLWRDAGTRLKRLITSKGDEYDKEINRYKNVDVLFIDDIFKARRKNNELSVTDGDVNLAFEILNYRYISRRKTIISSELSGDELEEIDEAIFGRIFEMTKHSEYFIYINKDAGKNYRTKGEKQNDVIQK